MITTPSNPNNGDEHNKKDGDTPAENAVPRDSSLPNDLTPLRSGQDEAHKRGSKLGELLLRGTIAGVAREVAARVFDQLQP
ncbi:hypothetical protein ITJ42_16015 [Clavibacter michiganensis subsp. phaseoli]|uniref:Uncharacterized protein n=1 Tax=Clavibacter phaseoli TaxID=1734031 RepID=A0A8I0SDD4_9MICO|nr:hypothetical protein [Clavibacter phaseoli]MBF4632726.1 hypothetical protein [Clavibacter phaseoli]